MEFRASAEMGDGVIYDIFEVDEGTWFAHPRGAEQGEYKEFYFALVGNFWLQDTYMIYSYPLRRVVEALDFVFINILPIKPGDPRRGKTYG